MTTAATTFRWKKIAEFWVPGEPRPQPRPRARALKLGDKWTAQVYNPKDADGWKLLVGCHSLGRKPAAPLACAVKVHLAFYCPRPKSASRKSDPDGPILNATRPDVDNYAKSTIDAMQDNGWFEDDSRITELSVSKLYHAKGGKPGAMITVSVVDDEQGDLF